MEVNAIEQYSSLLNEFSKLLHPTDLLDDYSKLLSTYKTIHSKAEYVARTVAPDFNIFTLLGVSRNEVFTHSTILSEILNPMASHGQGSLFLRSFFELCLLKDPDNQGLRLAQKNLDNDKWGVLKEYSTIFGRMDIVIINPAIGFLLVIENKIDASEQNDQLKRYGNWIDGMKRDYPFSTLVFLTVRGNQAVSSGSYPFIPLSYKDDISTWLQNIINVIEAPVVKAVIQQYFEIARIL